MTNFTKGEIDRLGNNIRKDFIELNDEILITLQDYRTSHQQPLANIFKLICKIGKSIHHSSIATYRIKRFESIINKLDRYPEMRFSRMWDIAGCRIILRNNSEIYQTLEKIKSNNEIEVIKINDYILNPQKDGYKCIHLYLKHITGNVIVEVQLRTLENHNWATLVEITDLLYNTRLKEIGDDKELYEFHRLLSNVKDTSINEKYKIIKILKERNYFENLSEVFSKNYLIVRKQWLKIETKTNHKYFLIEVESNTPKIKSFASFNDAETEYFNLYKKKSNSNIVLTYLQNHQYDLLATAYANYILTFHSFLYECLEIIETLIVDYLTQKKYLKLKKTYNLYNELIYRFNKNILQELDDSYETQFQNLTQKERNLYNKKRNLWLKDIQKQISKISSNQKKIQIKVKGSLRNSGIKNLILKYIIKFSDKRYRKLNKKLVDESIVMKTFLNR